MLVPLWRWVLGYAVKGLWVKGRRVDTCQLRCGSGHITFFYKAINSN